MAETTFQESIATERTRLRAEQKAIAAQQKELEKKLADITRELSAIDAYENAKKPPSVARTRTPRKAAATKTASHARRGSKREPILKLIADNPTGLSRGDILTKLGVKGDKSGEMSVSNALTALTKGKQVARKDGKYVAA